MKIDDERTIAERLARVRAARAATPPPPLSDLEALECELERVLEHDPFNCPATRRQPTKIERQIAAISRLAGRPVPTEDELLDQIRNQPW